MNPRIPGYLGRVLNADGAPAGTCFQVAPGVLVTAWHVLDDLGSAHEGNPVAFDALNGSGDTMSARVEAIDPLHDLAVLRAESALPGSVTGWFATDWVYNISLAIAEELGDRAGMAATISQRGLLALDLGDPYGAVEWHLCAAMLRAQLEVPDVIIDLRQLLSLRADLGSTRFNEAAAGAIPVDEMAAIFEMMDRQTGAEGA